MSAAPSVFRSLARSAMVFAALTPSLAFATDAFDPEAGVVTPSERWERVERLVDASKHMKQERFHEPSGQHALPEIVKAFDGDATPPSSEFLLHYTKGWSTATNPVPVLLIHGAGLTSSHCFAAKPIEQPYEGLAARLARSGRAVFALTFAHPHGDNVIQAEALADAVARVRAVTHAKQVDLVAHSKGGMAARIYLSNAGPKWATRYRGDVRRYVMLGTPNGGIDVAFAFPNLNYWILETKTGAPLTWTEGLYWGRWTDWKDRTIYAGGPFPGQAQMTARWDQRYGLTRAEGQFDVSSTYEGRRGAVSVSLGIDKAIADGDGLIAKLRRTPIAKGVELAVLAGSSNWIMHQVGERRGPSDGLLLVASALEVEPMLARGATLIRKSVLHLNHLQLVYEPRANDWVLDVLDQRSAKGEK